MLSSLAPHEHRERWLASIAGSFPRTVLWRAARTSYVQIKVTIKRLHSHIFRITQGLQTLWLGSAVLAKCDQFLSILISLENGYSSIMAWLEGSRYSNGHDVPNWRNSESRVQRELIIKQMVIFQARYEQMRELLDIFDHTTKSLTKHDQRVSKRLQRSASCSDMSELLLFPTHSVLANEERLREFVQDAAWTFDEARLIIKQKYNSGQLFADFVHDILQDVSAEKALYKQRRKTYPYPSPKLIIGDDNSSEFWREYGPLEDVPMLENDEHVEWLLF